MKIVELHEETFPGVLFEAVRTLRNGGVMCYPADTVYGIGGNALDERVARKVFRVKRRSQDKPLIVLVRDVAMARRYAYIDLWTENVLSELWPGPVTVVLHRKDMIPQVVAGRGETVALRWPNCKFVNEVMRQVDFPLISTSANISGESASPRAVGAFLEAMKTAKVKPDLVIDAGELPAGEPSTILDLTDRKHPVILRRGVLTKEELEKTLQSQLWKKQPQQ